MSTTRTTENDDDDRVVFEKNTRTDQRSREIASECRRRLMESIKKIAGITKPETRGLLLSGGVDSTAILEAAAEQDIAFALAVTVVVISDDKDNEICNRYYDAPDDLYAHNAAQRHGLKHVVVRLTTAELVEKYTERTIETVQVWGRMDVRNSLVISAAMDEARKHGIEDLLIGDAADEIFGGYPFMFGNPNEHPNRWRDHRDNMVHQWTFVTQKLARSFGLIAHEPFMDRELLVDWALTLDRKDCTTDDQCLIQLKFGGPRTVQTVGKMPLREAFPNNPSAWRRMDFIDVGSGAIVVDESSHRYFSWPGEHNVSDQEFSSEKERLQRDEGICIQHKEHLFNIRIYQKLFGGLVHPTKQRFPVGDPRGCVACTFEIGEDLFCHQCDIYPAQQWKIDELQGPAKGKTT